MRWDRPPVHETILSLPSWVVGRVEYDRGYATDEERMRLAIRLAAENIANGTGGPFGAAVFERGSGRLIAVGVDSVVRLNNSTAHAEMLALQLAQRRIASGDLAAAGHPAHELFTTCAPCAMCLGAVHLSGVTRLVSAARREDTTRQEPATGTVAKDSSTRLRAHGIEIVEDLLRPEARAVLIDGASTP